MRSNKTFELEKALVVATIMKNSHKANYLNGLIGKRRNTIKAKRKLERQNKKKSKK